MTEQQAKEKLRNEKGGAFLVRFNTPAGFLLSKKSRAGDSVLDFAIGASDTLILNTPASKYNFSNNNKMSCRQVAIQYNTIQYNTMQCNAIRE